MNLTVKYRAALSAETLTALRGNTVEPTQVHWKHANIRRTIFTLKARFMMLPTRRKKVIQYRPPFNSNRLNAFRPTPSVCFRHLQLHPLAGPEMPENGYCVVDA